MRATIQFYQGAKALDKGVTRQGRLTPVHQNQSAASFTSICL
jgi:hypothetical protein